MYIITIMKITENKYAKEIRAVRAWLGWSQSRLAKKIGLTQRTISLYETGQIIPSVATWDKIMALKQFYESEERFNDNDPRLDGESL